MINAVYVSRPYEYLRIQMYYNVIIILILSEVEYG